MDFDYNLEPGKKLNSVKYKYKNTIISIVIPFYNDGKYIEQSVQSVLNQTFPCYEILIIDDGSSDKFSLNKLEEVSKLDNRIKVFHKENGGLASTRDFGAKKSNENAKYLFFLDSDDIIDKTYLECAYLSLELNPDAAWAYSDVIGFGAYNYLWNKWFDSKKMVHTNDLVATSLIRKDVFNSVNGYEIYEKSINEDWNFWLKLIAKEYYPLHLSFYGMWYRRKNNSGELYKSKMNKKRAMEIVRNTAKRIKKEVKAVQFPIYDPVDEHKSISFESIKKIDNKKNVLMIIPWIVTGGADRFNYELIKRLSSKYNFIIITTVPSTNPLRQKFEKYSTIYDLNSFSARNDWHVIIDYLIKKENIDIIFNTNSRYGYALLPYLKEKYPSIPIMDYVHMEEWYYENGGFAKFSSENKDIIDYTLVCNNHTKNVMVDYFGVDKESIDTVYIGVDSKKFDPKKYNKEEIIKKYNLDIDNKKVVSFICRITAQKRPMLLAEIIKKTVEKNNNIIFLIVGTGDLLNAFKEKITLYNLNSYVCYLGNILEVEEIYKISDITINCSIKEGVALTTYESLSMNVPVVSSDVGGQSELITNDVGKIIKCYQEEKDINDYNYKTEEIDGYVDSIIKVINNLDKYNKCREKILNGYTLENMAKNMDTYFEMVIKKNIRKYNRSDKPLNILKKYLKESKEEYNYFVREYQKSIYGKCCINQYGKEVYSSRIEILGEKLWKYDFWRKIVNSKVYKKIRRR